MQQDIRQVAFAWITLK